MVLICGETGCEFESTSSVPMQLLLKLSVLEISLDNKLTANFLVET